MPGIYNNVTALGWVGEMHTRVSKNPFLPPYHVLLEQGILTDTIILNIFSPCSFPMIHAHKMERTLFYLVVAPGAFGITG